jgi:hypothetical protein
MLAPQFQLTMLVTMALYLPISLLFWHAPALVHWHGISPVKSLFFSLVACSATPALSSCSAWDGSACSSAWASCSA